MFTLGSPPAGCSSSRVVGVAPTVSPFSGAFAYGRGYWNIKGTGVSGKKEKNAGADAKDDIDIIIPTDITLDNYTNYTFYQMLGVTESQCDEATLKKSYHKAVLLYHPDKKYNAVGFQGEDGEEDRTVFLKIQQAYDTLRNTEKKRAYDSQLPFNESCPSEKKIQKALDLGGNAYYQVWGKVFDRNARFSCKQPVPSIGDSTTSYLEVCAFYDFWTKFDSWRDFTGQDAEHDPESASSREEKRWMIKENDRVAAGKKKAEMLRITDMVMKAMSKDPRIAAEKNKKNLAKKAAAEAREAEANAKKASEEAAAAAAAVSSASNKADKEKYKKAASKSRNLLKKLLRKVAEVTGTSTRLAEYGKVTEDDIGVITAKATLGDLTAMTDAMGSEPASKDDSVLIPDGLKKVMDILEALKLGKDTGCSDTTPVGTPVKVNAN